MQVVVVEIACQVCIRMWPVKRRRKRGMKARKEDFRGDSGVV